ncbi:retrotransposon hot spot (RHS) protein, putative [Trypanosoma brucei gambiense DAL972]|uniref:Retrotransposon hot spot (RHS) protein, putative n=1 Tax=Trypanosoma brucei gambiense (strain MHOM/CI/86/DAL972) TaxID=679716 RepID=C9ZN99_TRYB9|nr:retrotransposon hot spot (RHS) protein, putative [Trypanosoma brucei gambiense DAL972]CBH10877.1 retrotransposon hot spot (RHS) protein, putative [Trypanosoma brucei gambiense DAL972]|eukprot:XP_011773164.1 retrotransposon hot spot (RHS) protein, putative [Trypanosoma brucei gambiense DAL972]
MFSKRCFALPLCGSLRRYSTRPYFCPPLSVTLPLWSAHRNIFRYSPTLYFSGKETNCPKWVLGSNVKNVLLEDYEGLRDMTLHEFLLNKFLNTYNTRNVAMDVFVKNPRRYIVDAEVLENIQDTDEFKTVRTVIDLSEKVDYLIGKEISTLRQWEEKGKGEIRDFVGPVVGGRLDAAVITAKEERERAAQTAGGAVEIKGVYESIYNATWSYVESGHREEPLGMKVFNGRPQHMWTKEEVDISHTPETMNEPLPRHGNLEIAVLTSQVGWPCTFFKADPKDYDMNSRKEVGHVFMTDVYIRREVMRLWYKVEQRLNWWLMGEVPIKATPYVLIGTPGIGKSFSVGSFLLYKLLHYEASQLQIIIYVVEGKAHVFRKPKGGRPGYVTFYKSYDDAFVTINAITRASSNTEDIKGYLIFDVGKGHPAPMSLPYGFTGIALSSPDVKQFHEWAKQNTALSIYINCDTLEDLEAIHISRWGKIAPAYGWNPSDAKEKIETEWQKIESRIRIVGPPLRHIVGSDSFKNQFDAMKDPITDIQVERMEDYINIFRHRTRWRTAKPSHKLVQVVRVKEDNDDGDQYCCKPLSSYTGEAILDQLKPWLLKNHTLATGLLSNRAVVALLFEQNGAGAMLHEDALIELAKGLRSLPFVKNEIQQSVLQVLKKPKLTEPLIEVPEDTTVITGAEIEYMKLYKPQSSNFPVVDAFFFVENPKTFVGLQHTISERHPCSVGGLVKMKKYLRSYFKHWDNFSNDMVWEIIYVQRVDSEIFTRPQKCERSTGKGKHNNEDEEKFWREKVRQFSVSLNGHITALYVELQVRGNNNNRVNNRGGNIA